MPIPLVVKEVAIYVGKTALSAAVAALGTALLEKVHDDAGDLIAITAKKPKKLKAKK